MSAIVRLISLPPPPPNSSVVIKFQLEFVSSSDDDHDDFDHSEGMKRFFMDIAVVNNARRRKEEKWRTDATMRRLDYQEGSLKVKFGKHHFLFSSIQAVSLYLRGRSAR